MAMKGENMKQSSHKHLGELIRQLRQDAGLTVRELSAMVAKVSAATITNIEIKGVIGSLQTFAALRACPVLDGLVERAVGAGLLTEQRLSELLEYEAQHTPHSVARAELVKLHEERTRKVAKFTEARLDRQRGFPSLSPEAIKVLLDLRKGALYASDPDRLYLIGPLQPGLPIADSPRQRLRPLSILQSRRLIRFLASPEVPQPHCRVLLTKESWNIKL